MARKLRLERAFAAVEEHDVEVKAIMVPRGRAGIRILEDLRAWSCTPRGCLRVGKEVRR